MCACVCVLVDEQVNVACGTEGRLAVSMLDDGGKVHGSAAIIMMTNMSY